MKVIKVTPQGYCFGVVRAINIAKKAAQTEEKPIYILGDIVHNEFVTKSLQNLDLITVEAKNTKRTELLDNIEKGTVIFTAHGVSPKVREIAKNKNLNMIDATCPEVMNTQEQIKKYLQMDYKVIFVGKKNHPEAEACIEIDPKNTFFISSHDDINKIDFTYNKYFITYQSTLNTEDVFTISEQLEQKLKDKIFTNNLSVCDATKTRQDAVKNLKNTDLLIVVGDKNSNNSNKLVEIAKKSANINAVRILEIDELDLNIFKDIKNVAVTSGASTPTQLTKHIINFLEQFDYNNKETWKYEKFNIIKMI